MVDIHFSVPDREIAISDRRVGVYRPQSFNRVLQALSVVVERLGAARFDLIRILQDVGPLTIERAQITVICPDEMSVGVIGF